MALTTQTHLGTHQFNGPHANASFLPSLSGVYIITRAVNNQHEIIDVGESGNIAQRIPDHERMGQWERVASNGFHVWTLPADETQRMLIEQAHRIAYNPTCGER